MRHELARGSEQVVEIFLERWEFLQLSVIKGDVNLSVALFEPGGQQLLEYISHSYETMGLAVVAGSAGTFVLKVRSLESVQEHNQFELKVQPVRVATEWDFQDSAARLALADASKLCADWTEASFRRAIDKYLEAGSVWRSAGNASRTAEALRRAGEVYFILGEYRQALESYERAAVESKKAGDRLGEAQAISESGRLYSLLGNNNRAQKVLASEVNYYARYSTGEGLAGIKQAYAQALNNLGEVYYSKGDLVNASEHFERSLKLFREIGDRNRAARSILFGGYIADTIGELEKATAQFSQAHDLYRETGNRSGEALSLTAIGITHSLKREDESGIKLHHEAMNIFRVIGDRQSEAITLNAVGQAFENLNEKKRALEYYKRALRLVHNNATIDFEAVTLYQIAGLYRSIGDAKQALQYYEACANLSRAAKKTRMEAYALNDLASVYAEQGKPGKALRQYRKVLRFYAAIDDRRGQAFALNNIGDFYRAGGQKSKALSSYKLALPLSRQSGERGIEITTLYNIARAARDSGDFEVAKSHIESSIGIIETLRTNVASPDFRSSYFSGLRKHYDFYIDLLMKLEELKPGQGFVAAALLASEGARARAFIEILAEAGADIRQNVDLALLKRERELQHLLAAQARYQLGASDSDKSKVNEEATSDSQKLDLLKAEYEALQAQVRNQNPRYEMLTRPRPLTVEEIQAQLGEEDMMLQYALGDERSYLWAMTSNSLTGYELPSRAILETAAREVYELLTARQVVGGKVDEGYQVRVEAADSQYYEKALAISRLLLGPVATKLGRHRLLVVSEGALQYIPFDALPPPTIELSGKDADSDDWMANDRPLLIAEHEVVSLPSISTLAAIRAETNRPIPPDKLVAVFADPVFSVNDDRVLASVETLTESVADSPHTLSMEPAFRDFRRITNNRGDLIRLTHADAEANAILVAASGGAWVIKGFDATREKALDNQVAQYRIVHFATHGFVNTERPELSGIVLTMIKRDGRPENGFLQLHDIYNLKLSAELTVLSACDTGLGKDIRGEGLIGLTRGFMFAGSRSVVASLWKVDDRATAVLMGHFYKAMLQEGLAPAAALRSAKEKLRKEKAWQSPFFWAGFVLQGEYDRPIKVDHKVWIPWGIALLVILTVISGILLVLNRYFQLRKRPPKY